MSAYSIFKTVAIVFGVWYLGDIVHIWIHAFPSVIAGFVLMFFLLVVGIVKEEHVKPIESIFVPTIAILFVPSAINLYFIWDQVSNQFIQFIVFIVLSFFIVFLSTFLTAKLTMKIFRVKNIKKGD